MNPPLMQALHEPPFTLDTHAAVKASKEEMDKNQVDLALRDACAHLLIPLNKCVRVIHIYS